MGLAFVAFIAVFVLITAGGLLFAYRAGMSQRLSAALAPDGEHKSWWTRITPGRAGDSIKAAIRPFDKVLPKSPQEVSIVQKRLIRAGLREDSYVRIFYGSKAAVPLLLCLLITFAGLGSNFMLYILALGLGYLAPDFWLGRRIKKRHTQIRLGLPDFLDLLVVCIEAGLSMDQALARTSDELKAGQPEIADEIGLVLLEQRAGRVRIDAWRNLAERVDIEIVRTLVGAIIQTDQFGTSIAKTLRVYADGLRVKRRQQVEELAAKTAIKLILPLVLFIFPTIFIMALGPTILSVQESFTKYFK